MGGHIRQSLIQQTTAIIKSFERPRALERLLRSLRWFYPAMRVLVADDSLCEPPIPTGVDFHRLPPDVGASAGRNYLLERVQTPFFWLLDDDFELTRATDFAALVDPIAEGRADLVAGDCIRCKRKFPGWIRHKPSPFFGGIELRNGVLKLTQFDDPSEPYLPCDITPNFFVAKTATVRELGGWDADMKTEEHEEFFVRCHKRGLRTLYCPAVKIRHWSELPPHYARFRRRSYRPVAARKHGIHTWIDMNGSITRFERWEGEAPAEPSIGGQFGSAGASTSQFEPGSLTRHSNARSRKSSRNASAVVKRTAS